VTVATSEHPDAIILDLVLPDISGFEVCRMLREELTGPIIMLSSTTSPTAKVVGLDAGADDYVTKPVTAEELVARVRAHLRRAIDYNKSLVSQKSPPIEINDVRIDPEKREVIVRGEPVHLTAKEFNLLYLLMANAGKAVSRTEILRQVWNMPSDADDRTLTVHIRYLRTKIEEDDSNPKLIKTVQTIGYKFALPEDLEKEEKEKEKEKGKAGKRAAKSKDEAAEKDAE
jgi:DNA-binding response OmpR family regulator